MLRTLGMIPLIIGGFSVASVQQPAPPLESGRELLDCVLPLRDVYEVGQKWAVAVRIVPAFQSEWLLTMARDQDGRVTAEVSAPNGYQVAGQLQKLSGDGRGPTCARAQAALKIERCKFDSAKLPELTKAADMLEEQKWPARPQSGWVPDATMYEFRLTGFISEHRLLVQGPTDRKPTTTRDHPAVLWSEDLYHLLGTCK